MLAIRVMPCLLMDQGALVKTVQFKKPTYIGDPVNAVRIFNQKEVDELLLIDITATTEKRGIDFETLEKLVTECFMPICYGGGVDNLVDMRRLYHLGIEKISLSAAAITNPELVREAAAEFGNQAIVVTLDVKKNLFGKHTVRTHQGKTDTKRSPVEVAREMEQAGAGEILLYSIDKDGTWSGFDLDLIQNVTRAVGIPVIACGGAGELAHLRSAVNEAGASAVAIGSMAVFQAKDLGVLIKFPTREQQEKTFE
ncbi:imidazoleglycerol phosphate synthase [Janthinobacterium sp. Marseille]|nr:AglZ/HisF2 family acetamidino modification protein [Janthinobacterium sp. Marseille]ABR91599.1 imidazoleglycerol phosphate synthase [Janthinobacterium sp. Marseille]